MPKSDSVSDAELTSALQTTIIETSDSVTDAELTSALQTTIIHDNAANDERAWAIEWREGVGRILVAKRPLEKDAVVFRERPLVVAEEASATSVHALRGVMTAVAIELLRSLPDGAGRLLQVPHVADKDQGAGCDGHGRRSPGHLRKWASEISHALRGTPIARTVEDVEWALGVAVTNTHGSVCAARDTKVGVLFLLGSMMQHDCKPSTTAVIAPVTEASTLTLKTTRSVAAGEPLSICYVDVHAPLDERRRQLLFQHGFLCACKRCEAEAALMGVRAHVKPRARSRGRPQAQR